MSPLLVIVLTSFVLVAVQAESLQRQCLCSEVDHCRAVAEQGIEHCAEKCKHHAIKLGVNIPAARQCVLAQKGRILKGVECVRQALGQICTDKPGPMITRRYPETAQLVAVREATALLNKVGMLSQATALVPEAKGAAACAMKCGKEHPCYKLGCSLQLPPDDVIVATLKRCAFQAGLTTQLAKEACACIVNAGLKQAAPFCPKIDVSLLG